MCSGLIKTKLLPFLNVHPDVFRNTELFQRALGFEQRLKKLAYFSYWLGSYAIAIDKASAPPGIQRNIPVLLCWTGNPRYKKMFVEMQLLTSLFGFSSHHCYQECPVHWPDPRSKCTRVWAGTRSPTHTHSSFRTRLVLTSSPWVQPQPVKTPSFILLNFNFQQAKLRASSTVNEKGPWEEE